jgi:hypothetical protein
MRKAAQYRARAKQAARTDVGFPRRIWLAGLGTFAIARGTVDQHVAPWFKGLVSEGRTVEQRLIRKTGDVVERGVAVGKSGWQTIRTTVDEIRAAASRAVGMQKRPRGGGVDALARRVEALESNVHTMRPRRAA